MRHVDYIPIRWSYFPLQTVAEGTDTGIHPTPHAHLQVSEKREDVRVLNNSTQAIANVLDKQTFSVRESAQK